MNVQDAITRRVTTKMLGDIGSPLPGRPDIAQILAPIIEQAGWAPFHRPAHTVHRSGCPHVVEPWRYYLLDSRDCRKLMAELQTWPEKTGKILNMLAAADGLLQVTWLPNPPAGRENAGMFDATEENMEHIAAAAASVQTFLLGATAAGLSTYWSSGGVLRSDAVFNKLGIDVREILLGSIFVFPSEPQGETEILSGKQRTSRSPAKDWFRQIQL